MRDRTSAPSAQAAPAAHPAAATVSALISAFYQSYGFTKNQPVSQASTRNVLEHVRARHGDRPVADLQRADIQAMMAEKTGRPAAQRNLLKAFRLLLAFAVDSGLRADNPALGIKRPKQRSGGYYSATEDDLRRYEARYPRGTRERLAFDLMLYTACRLTDVVGLGPANIRNGRLTFTYSKNKTPVDYGLPEPLAMTLAATKHLHGAETFLLTEYGKPFSAPGFANWFKDRCRKAGLPRVSAHSLRKAALRRMAEAGCSEDEIAAVSGHRDTREIRVYVAAANRAKMADQGIRRTLASLTPAHSEPATLGEAAQERELYARLLDFKRRKLAQRASGVREFEAPAYIDLFARKVMEVVGPGEVPHLAKSMAYKRCG